MCKQILIIIGLGLSLFGAYKLYKSIMPFPHYYAKDGLSEAFPVATLNINVARTGFIYVFIGIIFQIIAMFIK